MNAILMHRTLRAHPWNGRDNECLCGLELSYREWCWHVIDACTEVHDGVVPEEPEWEYGVGYQHFHGPEVSRTGEASARDAVRRRPNEYTLMQRTKAVPAGEWVPVKQEN